MSHGDHEHRASRNLGVAFFLNLVFIVLEVAGGLWTNSIAILTDALHDAGDCFSIALAWYLQKVSLRTPDAQFTYGYRRFSSLGALITGVVLVAGLAVVGWNAIQRLQQPEAVRVPGVLALAVAGILLNGAAAWKLSGGRSLNEKVASWHLLEDTFGWCAVLIGGIVMAIWDLPIVDPILALAIALFVLWNVVRHLRKVLMVMLQSAPPDFDAEAFTRRLEDIPGIVAAHHTHTWTLDGITHVFSTHLVMTRESGRQQVVAAKRRVHELLRDQDFAHVTVEVELEGETCAAEPGSHGEEAGRSRR
jgi:cobalt-zinc-cadmium efflux system protein